MSSLFARLLADDDDLRGPPAFTEHGLRGVLPEVACPAMGRGLAPGGEALGLGKLGIFVAGLRLRLLEL